MHFLNENALISLKISGLRLNINTIFLRYGDPHVKDKMVARPYTAKTTSLYWDGPQGTWGPELGAQTLHFLLGTPAAKT